jgi:hypothetical protein
MDQMLGMYVHMHWGYNRPYAARSWTLGDWRSYAAGLSALGYNLIMIWPLCETMPDPLTPSDIAHLEKLRTVIDMLQADFGMTVLVTFGANTVGNVAAADYTFEERPFFKTDLRLNPGDPAEVDRLLHIRRNLYSYLAKCDGMVMIDSDPGGYVGSTNDEFADLLQRHMEIVTEANPNAMIYYWLWAGWEGYNRFWERTELEACPELIIDESDWVAVIQRLQDNPDDPWRLLVCNTQQRELVSRLGVADRSLYFPYGLVEGEPTYPLTNCDPVSFESEIGGYPWDEALLGCMANAQNHVLQFPGTYLFAEAAKGASVDISGLRGFAANLVPEFGDIVIDAWMALAQGTSEDMRRVATAISDELIGAVNIVGASTGRYSALLMGESDRFLSDLEMQLTFRADLIDAAQTIRSGDDARSAVQRLTKSWRVWMGRTGFVDAYLGPVETILHPALAELQDPGIDAVLADFDNWSDPTVRNDIVPRLLAALENWVR